MPRTPELPRWILHADMDAFYASIEQRDNPKLKGLPVIVGATSPRGVVAAASYEARRFGVHSAMPGFRARELCPHGVFLRSNMRRYVEVSRQVREVFSEFTSVVEPLALDEAFLDISGSLSLYGTPLELATLLKKRIYERVALPVSVGVAPSKLVAKIACTLGKPNGLEVVEPDRVAQVLDPLPVRRLWGVGPVLERQLAELNIRTIRDLSNYDGEWLSRLLGDRAFELQARARGEDPRAVAAGRVAKSYGEENTFERDISDREAVSAALTAHSEAVARRLRNEGLLGKIVTLKIKLGERRADVGAEQVQHRLYPLVTRRTTLARATDDATEIRRAVLALWDEANVTAPVRLLGVTLSGLCRAAEEQLELFGGDQPTPRLGPTLDAIQRRFGPEAIRRGAEKPAKVTPSLRLKRGE